MDSPPPYREVLYKKYVTTKKKFDENITPEIHITSKKHFFIRVIKQYFPKARDKRIIDFGCGDGALLYFAKKAGYHNVSGYDASPEQINIAKLLGLQDVHLKDALTAISALPSHTADIVVSFDVIEHMTKEEVLIFASEVHRILAPSGKWIVHTVNAESPFFGRIRYGDLTHENGFTQSAMQQLLSVSGFNEMCFYEDTPIAHGFKSTLRSFLWKFVRTFYRFCLAVETGDKNGIFSQNFLIVSIKT